MDGVPASLRRRRQRAAVVLLLAPLGLLLALVLAPAALAIPADESGPASPELPSLAQDPGAQEDPGLVTGAGARLGQGGKDLAPIEAAEGNGTAGGNEPVQPVEVAQTGEGAAADKVLGGVVSNAERTLEQTTADAVTATAAAAAAATSQEQQRPDGDGGQGAPLLLVPVEQRRKSGTPSAPPGDEPEDPDQVALRSVVTPVDAPATKTAARPGQPATDDPDCGPLTWDLPGVPNCESPQLEALKRVRAAAADHLAAESGRHNPSLFHDIDFMDSVYNAMAAEGCYEEVLEEAEATPPSTVPLPPAYRRHLLDRVTQRAETAVTKDQHPPNLVQGVAQQLLMAATATLWQPAVQPEAASADLDEARLQARLSGVPQARIDEATLRGARRVEARFLSDYFKLPRPEPLVTIDLDNLLGLDQPGQTPEEAALALVAETEARWWAAVAAESGHRGALVDREALVVATFEDRDAAIEAAEQLGLTWGQIVDAKLEGQTSVQDDGYRPSLPPGLAKLLLEALE